MSEEENRAARPHSVLPK